MSAVDRVVVVVPARNEERRLGRALRAITVARHALLAADPGVVVRIVVVPDRCDDGTVGVLERFPEVRVVPSAAGLVGAARRTGVRSALDEPGVVLSRTWIATTDADSQVPPEWLLRHVGWARAGADLVLGTVVPDPAELSAPSLAAWRAQHPPHDGHPHVHGANLGVRAGPYVRASGFRRVGEHEDVLLAAAVRATGAVVVSPAGSPVMTSARETGRTPGGFAGYLSALHPRPVLDSPGLSPAGLGQQ